MGKVSSFGTGSRRTVEAPSWLAEVGLSVRETAALGKLRTASHDGAAVVGCAPSRAPRARFRARIPAPGACAGARLSSSPAASLIVETHSPERFTAARAARNVAPSAEFRTGGRDRAFFQGRGFPPSPESPPRGRAPEGPSGGPCTLRSDGAVNAERCAVVRIVPTERLTPRAPRDRNENGPAEQRTRPGQQPTLQPGNWPIRPRRSNAR